MAQDKVEITIGVGDGTGNLFVHGSYESIMTLQSKLLELEQLRIDQRRTKHQTLATLDWKGWIIFVLALVGSFVVQCLLFRALFSII